MVETVQDFVELFQCLNAHKAEYLIVGGYAVAFHGYPRLTGELDLWIRPDVENARRVLAALEDFGFAGIDLSAQDLTDPLKIVTLGYPPERVDFVCDLDGVDWATAWARRVRSAFGEAEVAFLGLE